MISVPIFLYSKYCKECPIVMRALDANQLLFLCVDNVDIRKKFLNDDKFSIRKVPSLLIYNERYKSFEKYQGSDQVLDWLTQNNYLEEEDGNDDDTLSATSNQTSLLPVSEMFVEEALDASSPVQEIPSLRQDVRVSTPQLDTIPELQPFNQPGDSLSIENTLPSSDNVNNIQPPVAAPPALSQEGLMDLSGMSDPSTEISPKKPNSVLNLAQQMQRERESTDDKVKTMG